MTASSNLKPQDLIQRLLVLSRQKKNQRCTTRRHYDEYIRYYVVQVSTNRLSVHDDECCFRRRFPNDLTNQVTRDGHDPVAFGGFADIYRGMLQSNRKSINVAIKAIKTYSGEGGNFVKKHKRLRREIKVWLNLRHGNVLPLFGTTMGFGQFPAMVCPWVENGTLSSYLDNRYDSLSVTELLNLLNDVASGLQYLHSHSVVHGDLSGSNVLVRGNGRACIADFGLSMLLTELGASTFATSHHVRGTLRWTAPELLDLEVPEHGVDEDSPRVAATTQSDVYSFGSIMLQVLSGKAPYHYYKREVQVLHAISKGNMPRRPTSTLTTECRWMFIQRCWSAVGTRRPSSEQVVEFTEEELAEHRSFGIVTPMPVKDVDAMAVDKTKGCLPIIEPWDGPRSGARECKELLPKLTSIADGGVSDASAILVAQSIPPALESSRSPASLGRMPTMNRPARGRIGRLRDPNSTRRRPVAPPYSIPDRKEYMRQPTNGISSPRSPLLSVNLLSSSMSTMEMTQRQEESSHLMGEPPCDCPGASVSPLHVPGHGMHHRPLASTGNHQWDGGPRNHHTVDMHASGSQLGSLPFVTHRHRSPSTTRTSSDIGYTQLSTAPLISPLFASGLDYIRNYISNGYCTSDEDSL